MTYLSKNYNVLEFTNQKTFPETETYFGPYNKNLLC